MVGRCPRDNHRTRGKSNFMEMVDLEEKTSNHLFDILSEWNDQLSHCSYYQNFETLPFQEFDALPQISADCAANEGETPAEKTAREADGGGSCQS